MASKERSTRKIIKEGLLVKQGGSKGGWKTWKTRYFVLDTEGWSYYKNCDEFKASLAPALGFLPFGPSMSLTVLPGVQFSIVGDRTITVRADSMASKEAWIAAFGELVAARTEGKKGKDKDKGDSKDERIRHEGRAAKEPTNPLLLALQFGVAFCLENQAAIIKNAQAGLVSPKEKSEKKKKKKKKQQSAEEKERRDRERKEARAVELQDPAFELSFDGAGSTSMGLKTPPHTILPAGQAFTVKLRAPRIFSTLRRQWGVSTADFVKDVCRDALLEFSTNSKSGAMFILSSNRRFVLKSASKQEILFLKKLAPKMSAYLQSSTHSLLCPMLGLFKVTFKGNSKDFVAMLNVDRSGREAIKAYDLKGSEFRRRAASDAVVGLDDNLKRTLFIEKHAHALMMGQLAKDVAFLAENDIMDYSLFVSVHDNALSAGDRDAASVLKGGDGKDGKDSGKSATANKFATSPLTGSRAPISPKSPKSPKTSPAKRGKAATLAEPTGPPLKPPEERAVPGRSGCGYAGVGIDGQDTEVYFLGVIDLLQTYTASRAVQSTFQKLVTRKEISIVDPKTYAERFLKAIEHHIQASPADLPDSTQQCIVM